MVWAYHVYSGQLILQNYRLTFIYIMIHTQVIKCTTRCTKTVRKVLLKHLSCLDCCISIVYINMLLLISEAHIKLNCTFWGKRMLTNYRSSTDYVTSGNRITNRDQTHWRKHMACMTWWKFLEYLEEHTCWAIPKRSYICWSH